MVYVGKCSAINPGACKQRTDCDLNSSHPLTISLSTARGGAGMDWTSLMSVIVGVRLEK